MSEQTVANHTNQNYINTIRDSGEMLDYGLDKKMTSELSNMFASQTDTYDPALVASAKRKVELELVSLGFSKPRVKMAGGNSQFLLFTAELDTNRGAVKVSIPADASGVALPDAFVAGDGLQQLTTANLNNYITEMSKRANLLENVSQTGEVQIPRVPVPGVLKTLASDIEENVMEVAVGFPPATVRMTKRMLVAELNDMGFKGSQVRVSHPSPDGFICEATINTSRGKVAIEVPIEMKNNSPLMPSVFASGDYVSDFTAENLKAFAMSDVDKKEASVSRQYSDLDSMGLQQLKELIVKAALDGDLDSCDEALAVVGEKFDGATYRNVIADYQQILLNMGNTQKNLKTAYDSGQFIKTPNSIHPIHKKLGRPITDLICDEFGEYHLKTSYASKQNQKEYGVLFNTSKILMGD